ncbi:MAG: serine hydrolase domain-containing protein [Leadbetterella sp.]
MRSFLLPFFFLLGIAFFSCKQGTSKKEENTANASNLQLTEVQIAKIRKDINADAKAKQIAEIINAKIKGGFNGNVLVAQKDVVVYQSSHGFQNDTVLNTPASKFQLASLSKTFTSVAVMKLVEEGKIGLENTIEDYIPTFPFKGVTIRSLLCHRSGLPKYEYEFDKKAFHQKLFPTNAELIKWYATDKLTIKANPPDHSFAYNNLNFALLASIVEITSGKTFEQYLNQNILMPLDMKETFVATSQDPELQRNKTQGYQGGRSIDKDIFDNILGDKGIYSTVGDLFKWYKGLKSEKILKKESLREMYTPRSFEHPGLRNYGFGFRLWVNELQQTDYVYHTGWWKGYKTIMFFDLRSDFVIILVSNKANTNVYNIRDIVSILQGKDAKNNLEDSILDQ